MGRSCFLRVLFNTAGPWLNLSWGGNWPPVSSLFCRTQRMNSFSHLDFTSHRRSTWIISSLNSLILCVGEKDCFFTIWKQWKFKYVIGLVQNNVRWTYRERGVCLVRGNRDFKHVFLISKFIAWSWVQWNTWEGEAGRVCAQASLDYIVRPCSKYKSGKRGLGRILALERPGRCDNQM